MKQITLVLLGVSFLLGCSGSKEETVGSLNGRQTQLVKEYSSNVESALLAVEATKLFERGNSKLEKGISDRLGGCVVKSLFDSKSRENGKSVSGVTCPIRAQWNEFEAGDATDISSTYHMVDSSFSQVLPISNFSMSGERISRVRTGRIESGIEYKGSSEDPVSGDVVRFRVTRKDVYGDGSRKPISSNYAIAMDFEDFSLDARLDSDGNASLNGEQISEDEFQSLFFVLK